MSRRAVALVAAALAALGAAAALYARSWVGFPDGHLTPYDVASARLLAAYAGVAGLAAAGLFALGASGRRGGLAWPAVALFALLTAGFVALGAVGLSGLDSGQGG